MKRKLLAYLAVLALVCQVSSKAAEVSTVATELKELVVKIQAKLKEGKANESDLADELKEFDTILARHKDEKTDEMAHVLYMEAALYGQVLNNESKADELFEQLKKDYPDSKVVASLKRQDAAKELQKKLIVGATFPDFSEKDLDGKPLSISALKGKVVLVDFWATWCGPCVAELPNVLKAYQKHHANGLEIVGISLDQDKDKLESFLKKKDMTWAQYFDGQGWENKLAQTYGVNSIPATYLLDREGKIIAKDLRGEQLEEAIATALAKN